jgi:chitinase
MIINAGPLSIDTVVGVTSYGRSFQMTEAGCWTNMCTYTGSDSGALPGECIQTAGYLAGGEIDYIIASNSSDAMLYMDEQIYSNIMVYDSTQWVAYMDEDNKEVRALFYQALNFAGTINWAIDLQTPSVADETGGDGDTGGEVYLFSDFWSTPTPFVICAPPCTIIPPPLPLATPTSIQWPLVTTSIAVQQSGGSVSTLTITVTLDPFNLVSVPV